MYGSRPVWSDATFALPEGSFTAVLGPNGAGKSTLLRLALGLLAPSSGSIEVFGGPPRRGSSGIGYVAQQTSFDPELSIRGREFVRLGLDGHRWGLPLPGRPAARASRLVDQVLEAVSALSYADRAIGRLSGGEQQRLRLAQALVGDPKILLLDEPLSHLDIGLQGAMVQLIADVARTRRLTVVLIAHDVNPLLRYTDQVVYVAHGRVAVGAPSEVITSEALSRIYGAPVEVLRDSRGRVFVVGLEEEVSHPHYD